MIFSCKITTAILLGQSLVLDIALIIEDIYLLKVIIDPYSGLEGLSQQFDRLSGNRDEYIYGEGSFDGYSLGRVIPQKPGINGEKREE